jgi:hypothetical protein
VTREPVYSRQAIVALDRLAAGSDDELHDAVCDAIDLICDHGDSAEARREQLRTASGTPLWKVAVRTRHDDWVVLWWPDGTDAQVYFIGDL